MKIREEFNLSQLSSFLFSDLTTIITGSLSTDERCNLIKSMFDASGKEIISIDYDSMEEEYTLDIVGDPVPPSHISKDVFLSVLKTKLSGHERSILIDLTSLQHAVIIVLLNYLCNSIKPAHLFASYVKPERYLERDFLGSYIISSTIFEPAGIPGIIRQQRDNEIVIPFLGFEGARLKNIIENMSYESIIPVIGFPSEDPMWQFDALRNCMQVLESSCPDADIKKCKSNSIYDALFLLDNIEEAYPGRNFVLIPLGIRPHTAACGIWASSHKNARIVYDFAVETEKRSDGIGEVLIYHLSRFIAT